MNEKSPQKVRLGRAWFGGSTRMLITVCAIVGFLLSNGFAVLTLVVHDPTYAVAAYLAVALGTWPIMGLLTWLILVDVNTVRGPTDPSEDSIETAWSIEAGFHAFMTLLVVCMGATLVFTFTELTVNTVALLWTIIGIGGAAYGLHYLRLKRAAG